jgi:cation diffusion facilitator CzcD-associated flavoprotein CzcO
MTIWKMTSGMKSAAMVGAGPAGLVTTRSLLRTQKFEVMVFEENSTVGELWSPEGLIESNLTTNMRHFTITFAGLSWDSVEFDSGGSAPMYPKASHVNRYLQEYYHRYVPDGTVLFNETVISADLEPTNPWSTGFERWEIITAKNNSDGELTRE